MFKIGNSKELPPTPDHLSEQGKDFIRKCLQRDPSQRPTAGGWACKKYLLIGIGGSDNLPEKGHKIFFETKSNISCPVSPCGSPLLESRSPQHTNGRMSPSPISSPRIASGASTPLSGGNGAIPFNHLKQSTHSNEGFVIMSRGPDDLFPSRPTDPSHGQFVRVQQVSQGLQERVISETDILSPQFGERHGNVFDLRDRLSPSEHFTCHAFVDHVKLNPSLDSTSGSPHPGLKRGN